MRKRIVGAAAGLAILFTAAGVQAQGIEDVKITASDLGKGIYMPMGRSDNIGLSAGPDGVFMVDDQFALLTPKIVAAIRQISKQPIRFVLNTHWHFDHTGGNENLGKAGVAIVAHDNVRRLMSAE